uniref:EF-hand domain-containing protein n=1 Tax=Anopheles farauti TaxID=69004 RepID=A0A182PZE7_9DIPT
MCPFRASSLSSVVDDGEEFVAIEDPQSRLHKSTVLEDRESSSRWYSVKSFVFGATTFRIVEELLKSVEESSSAIVDLDLAGCGYTNLHVQIVLDSLLQTRPACLTCVNLCRNRLFNRSIVCMLGNVLLELQSISYLSVCYNVLDDECIGILSEAVSNSGVRKFEATHCQISDRGGRILFNSLMYSHCIEIIDLSWNSLESNSGVEIGRFLAHQKSLIELIVVGNHLYNETQCIIPFLLGAVGNVSLKKLDLSWNSLRGEDFSRALLKALPQTKLKCLKLEHNLLENIELVSIVKMIKKHKSLEELWLGGNILEDEIALDLVIYQGVLMANPARSVDVQEMLLERCRFLAQKPKKSKQKRDFGHLMLTLSGAENKTITREEFELAVKRFRIKLDRSLLESLMDAFQASKSTVDTCAMAVKYLTRHPTEPPVVKPRKGKAKKE